MISTADSRLLDFRMRHVLTLSVTAFIPLALVVALSGCFGTVGVSAGVEVETPRLVLISPGLYVVEGQDAAVFYSNNYYWRYDGGLWYRSTYYDDGFTQVSISLVPPHIHRIDRPARYVRYRGGANARVLRRARPSHRNERAREHRQRNRRVEKRNDKHAGKRDKLKGKRDKHEGKRDKHKGKRDKHEGKRDKHEGKRDKHEGKHGRRR